VTELELVLRKDDAEALLLAAPVLGASAHHNGYRVKIGENPIVLNVRKLKALHTPGKLNWADVFTNWNVHLIAYGLSARTEDSEWWRNLDRLGLEVHYEKNAAILDIFPESSFTTVATLALDGTLKSASRGDGGAEVNAPDSSVDKALASIKLGAGTSLAISSSTQIVGKIESTLVIPNVQASGFADCEGEWLFHRRADTLLGERCCVHILRTPKSAREVNVKLRAFATTKTLAGILGVARFETPWLSTTVALPTKH